MTLNFAIIGGGLTGTSMLYCLVEKAKKAVHRGSMHPSQLKVQVFEKQAVFGPGLPHSDKQVMPFHITNMCAEEMSIDLKKPLDFKDWVTRNSGTLKKNLPHQLDSFESPGVIGQHCTHYPRAIMGEYLKARFKKAIQTASKIGLQIELYQNSEVTDVREDSDNVELMVQDSKTNAIRSFTSDRVLLATGHWFGKIEKDRFFPSPWPAKKLLHNIPSGVHVAVIGSSLSAIEVVLTLTSDGKFIRNQSSNLTFIPSKKPRKLTLYSRNGLLPRVRGRIGGYRNTILTPDTLNRLITENKGRLQLVEVFSLLDAELQKAYGRPIDWLDILKPSDTARNYLVRHLKEALDGDGPEGELLWLTVLHQIIPMARDIYINLTKQERLRFERRYSTAFFSHAATQPTINAEKLLALMDGGLVEVKQLGKTYHLIKDDTTGDYSFFYKNKRGEEKKDTYRYVVNARGQDKSLKSNSSMLTRNLIKSGTVYIDKIPDSIYRDAFNKSLSMGTDNETNQYKAGSVWIDTETHQIIKMSNDGSANRSERIYAVGAMTRGQIIDASMANGSVRSTSAIARILIDYLSGSKETNC